ncbi:uncharacterized protein KY384_007016 [Bacidia gigantensis]|uniref:uncharacterized protein n=1 Tax=Bacidia gigantensis TaxID=2732470 RepID=UPI001D05A63D|nr:uncharacterized protein KY384_007016 [Bacidia gigantensis]KAG8528100.1 hypothetical protein KY384_007016 [Bacidia gigantensis]
MAGGAIKYRHLSRSSAHRQALLRNLVTSLITHESIQTTWHKAKEAQRLAEKVISLGKKNTASSRVRAQQILFTPFKHLPKLFGELRERYAERPGGYTRVLHIEPINHHHDQAASAILELVDGPRDMRFAMTAKSLVRERAASEENAEKGVRDITARNVQKVTRFRPQGEEDLQREVERLEEQERGAKARERRREQKMEGAKKGAAEKEREKLEETEIEDDPSIMGRKRDGWERWDVYEKEQRARRRTVYRLGEMREAKAKQEKRVN